MDQSSANIGGTFSDHSRIFLTPFRIAVGQFAMNQHTDEPPFDRISVCRLHLRLGATIRLQGPHWTNSADPSGRKFSPDNRHSNRWFSLHQLKCLLMLRCWCAGARCWNFRVICPWCCISLGISNWKWSFAFLYFVSLQKLKSFRFKKTLDRSIRRGFHWCNKRSRLNFQCGFHCLYCIDLSCNLTILMQTCTNEPRMVFGA